MADLFENPIGTDGFEFVEFTSPEPEKLAAYFEQIGFTAVSKHRSKNVVRFKQNDINFILNMEPSGHAAEFREACGDRATVLVGQTPSYGDGVTFAPLVELLSEAAGRPGGEAEEVAERLRERLVGQPDAAAVGDRLAQVLGVGEAVASEASWAVRRLLELQQDAFHGVAFVIYFSGKQAT